MQSQPISFAEADYERWLCSALEAERQRLKLQLAPRTEASHPRPAAPVIEIVHAQREGDEA